MKVILLCLTLFCLASAKYFDPEGTLHLPKVPVYDGYSGETVEYVGGNHEYETHLPRPDLLELQTSFVTSTTTNTRTVRVATTSDVWQTGVRVVTVPVTQYVTDRHYIRESPDTVTSVIWVTYEPVVVETSTTEVPIVKTVVSSSTQFTTITTTVNYVQPIVHYDTTFDVLTIPAFETQTLLQVVHTTSTSTTTEVVTKTREHVRHLY